MKESSPHWFWTHMNYLKSIHFREHSFSLISRIFPEQANINARKIFKIKPKPYQMSSTTLNKRRFQKCMQSNTLPGMHVRKKWNTKWNHSNIKSSLWCNICRRFHLHHTCTLSEKNPRNFDNSFNTSTYDTIDNKIHLNDLLT